MPSISRLPSFARWNNSPWTGSSTSIERTAAMTDETPFGQPRPYPAKPETDKTPLCQPHPYPAPAGTPATSVHGVTFFSVKSEPPPKPPAPAPAAPDPIKGGEPTEASEAEHRRKAADEEHDANPKPTPELQ